MSNVFEGEFGNFEDLNYLTAIIAVAHTASESPIRIECPGNRQPLTNLCASSLELHDKRNGLVIQSYRAIDIASAALRQTGIPRGQFSQEGRNPAVLVYTSK